jgi:addiction module HigA family antidote
MARKRRKKPLLPNVHPGEILVEEFLEPLGISRYRLAKEIGVPMTRIAAICNGKRAITADTALRLARFFGTSARFWMGLQHDYDIEEASRAMGEDIVAIKPLGRDLPGAIGEMQQRAAK